MQNAFSTLKILSWNLGTLCVSFYRIRKIVGFFFEARCNFKIKLIKTKCIVMVLLWKQWFLWAKVKVSCLKMLETIVTEATFFSIWVFFLEHSQFTGKQGKGEAISLTLCRGDKTFWANNLWTGYSKWKD